MGEHRHTPTQGTSVPVSTPYGDGELQSLYVSELGFLMAKVYFKENGVWTTWNLGPYDIRNSPLSKAIHDQEWIL
jgi:hypothetical protein